MERNESQNNAHDILTSISSVVLGQDHAVRDCLVALIAGGHVLLEGVPGTAKTLLARSLAMALDISYARIQFTPDLMPGDITGISVLNRDSEFAFRRGPIFAHLVLADEINRAPAKTQAALLEAMQEHTVTVDGTTHQLPEPFTVFATQNPIEFEGTYPLPEAELDRFLLNVRMDYPALAVEENILTKYLEGFEASDPSTFGIRRMLTADGLLGLRRAAQQIRVEPRIVSYITALVRGTRAAASLTLGASPRAGIALLKTARALALLEDRDYVVPDDVKALATPVLRHRISLAPELELEGLTPDRAIAAILEKIEAPTA